MRPSPTTVPPSVRCAPVLLAGTLAATALTCAPATGAEPAAPTASAASMASMASTASTTSTASAASAAGVDFVDIKGDGGITLKANVALPSGAAEHPARAYPLIVLPTSWATPQIEYLAQARKLADSGYVVVSYNSRGFWQSGGEIEVGGPEDIADASRVIDWALAHTPADKDRVGMGGVSYGAGISLLAAAHDPRVKAVTALSGWADLIGSIYSGRTQHLQAAGLLGGTGELTGRPSPELRQVLKNFLGSNLDKEDEMIAWGEKRSPATYLKEINANGTAVMLGNAWSDSIFPPNQYADFFEKLRGPKRLEFRPGDHATAEATGLLGLPNDTWSHAHRWFDRYLKGERNGIEGERPVQLKSRTTGAYEGYAGWKDVPSGARTLALDERRELTAGKDSGANGGTLFLTGLLDQFLKLPPVVSVPLLPRSRAAVWESPRQAEATRVRGTATLHTTVTSTAKSGTFYAYLYDVGPLGTGKLITHAPYTFHDRAPGKPFAVDLELFSTAYDVPEGHKLAVVVDTADPLYAEHNPDGARLAFSSPDGDPSRVRVPTGGDR
ncbi:alpha/beta fold hydrolase [Streptomyces albus subsp. chlorinus]|uniref:alpha/beta fold hydrolase n=1 Tax=Streptomyces albus TaxID=1888 RepID=UPI00156DF436|nr:alpha/beta fold hydrolase [Streptomyces albus]NSC24586.1 alpha/beta fold hydrolase [Streptomyces albus subsp. chlorinus]